MPAEEKTNLSLEGLPPIYVLSSHLTEDQLHDAETELVKYGGKLTYNVAEARIFLAALSQKKRAAFELRSKGLWTEEIGSEPEPPAGKRRKQNDGSSDARSQRRKPLSSQSDSESTLSMTAEDFAVTDFLKADGRIVVVRLTWLYDSIEANAVQPLRSHLIYEAEASPSAGSIRSPTPHIEKVTYIRATPGEQQRGSDANDLAKAQSDGVAPPQPGHPSPNMHRRKFQQRSSPLLSHPRQPPKLRRTTTSEFERDKDRVLPDPPAWMKENQMYACCRSTYADPPNAPFIAQLEKIKEARLLTLDEIGVRAYATSIASISAYPHVVQSGTEILRLPGCDHKIASLWEEWYDSAEKDSDRRIEAVVALEKDNDLKHLKLFFEIWGVGPETAKRFYYDRGWKDLDDVIEYGWKTLNRVQQIGVKYYDEFLERIPRREVEEIAAVIHRHARSCRGIPEHDWDTDNDIVTVIVGGYRRGKPGSGDVDVVLSHRNEFVTKDLVIAIVSSLEAENWITHTLTLNTTTSDRNQQTLPYRGEGDGHGFDSLDKALCVWQNPVYDTEKHDKNPNIHRRVDIIIGAWRTVGCAVLGWSGANTFQRDIRRYVKREKGWKFDSSGVRDRATGHVLDLESPRNDQEGDTWLDREKRLMNGLGIGWRPPEERCTG